jgi:hypothetical protein
MRFSSNLLVDSRISEKDWQLSLRFSNFRRFYIVVLQETLLRVKKVLGNS